MAIYLVSYDLIGPNRDYDRISKHMETYRVQHRPLESVWFIETTKGALAVRDEIKKHVDANDKVLVVLVDTSTWATRNLGKPTTDWMHKYV